ncbi:cytochrome P450 [Mycena pura]|uniref:Cytochrome P450 n=1 Tax=Mycena pura TaxID=153505 RepID=A0AAD6VG69_9AGAR|nr:cytochrome P450 [Mycena pura]
MSLPALSFAAALFALFLLRRWRRASSTLPPGPPRDPIIGNLRQMPTERPPLVFHEWAKTYGDVVYLELPGKSIVLLDSLQAAEDLLDKRSAIYSDRPPFTLYEMFGWMPAVSFLPYGKQFTTHRQMHHSYLNRMKVVEHQPIQLQEARTLVDNLLHMRIGEHERYLSRFLPCVITQVVAGHRITSDDDPYLHLSKMVLESLFRSGPPGATAIDFFPFLRHFPYWFPGTYYARAASEWRPMVRELYDYPLRTVRAQKESGKARTSFILSQLAEMEESRTETEQDMEDLKGSAAVMFAAGESTTWGTLSSFLLAMVLHPECQEKAHKEIASVVGSTRLPDFADRGSLPYVECVHQEVFRWAAAVPLGVPHRVMEDDTYRGMLIPAGSTVFANIKGMTLDEKIYHDPHAFIPERYLQPPHGRGEPHFPATFGFGRRVCTGQYLADNSIWIAIATMLAACRISNAVDENGDAIVPAGTVSYGIGSHPEEFQCVITACSPQSAAIVRSALSFDPDEC